ncbi:hypothetical protein KDN32_00645 [Nocardioides sp. J2M5]|uniref:hypothetical protein n=1 Tax=Nocardioides palaemonis TaxID=2829810 RepID=UPI001BABC5B3|nr:hypothetical protein [Nocardioides palaemonis]MBS2936246.1 hypothetical protein [Nocardioides palaemonis]
MSKENALRAMREARYAEAQKRAGSAPARRPAPVAPAVERSVPARAKAAAPAADTDALCGHRNMSGRTCTREQGHPQKSHRYS